MKNANNGGMVTVDGSTLIQGGTLIAVVLDDKQAALIAAALNIGLMAMKAAAGVRLMGPARVVSPAEAKLKAKLRKTAKVVDGLTKSGQPRKRAPRTCGSCGEEGHDKRNCGNIHLGGQ